jgi:antitoxin ParD1/3/4
VNFWQNSLKEISMATMNISISDQMKSWVEEQANSGGYGNASDYVRDLIRRDQERLAERARLQALIDEGVNSGSSDKDLPAILTEARRRAGTSRS